MEKLLTVRMGTDARPVVRLWSWCSNNGTHHSQCMSSLEESAHLYSVCEAGLNKFSELYLALLYLSFIFIKFSQREM